MTFESEEAQSLEKLRSEAQEALDELFSQDLIPFKFTAHKIETTSVAKEYLIRFFDSRMPHLFILWDTPYVSFKELVQQAVLRRGEVNEWKKFPK